jgi:hypothetical protein
MRFGPFLEVQEHLGFSVDLLAMVVSTMFTETGLANLRTLIS